MKTKNDPPWARWVVPALSLAIGVGYLVASWLGGRPILGVALLGIMVAYAALLALGGGSETLSFLRSHPADERTKTFDLRATAFAGGVLTVALLGGLLYELARGQGGWPYAPLLALAGVSYLIAFFWLRARS